MNLVQTFSWSWPAPAPSHGAQQWRERMEDFMTGFGQEEIRKNGGSFFAFPGRYTMATRFVDALVNRDTTGLPGVDGFAADRRAVLTYLGQICRRNDAISTIVETHINRWMSIATTVAWQDHQASDTLPDEALNIITIIAECPGQIVSYKSWLGPNDTGLHGDLVAFLTAFERAWASQEKAPPLLNQQLAKSCLVFRALAVVEPERMPSSTMALVEQMEQRLDMNVLRFGNTIIDSEFYGLIRSAGDRKILEKTLQQKTNEPDLTVEIGRSKRKI